MSQVAFVLTKNHIDQAPNRKLIIEKKIIVKERVKLLTSTFRGEKKFCLEPYKKTVPLEILCERKSK